MGPLGIAARKFWFQVCVILVVCGENHGCRERCNLDTVLIQRLRTTWESVLGVSKRHTVTY